MSAIKRMTRLVDDQVIRQDCLPDDYSLPPEGDYTFRITGYSEPVLLGGLGGTGKLRIRIELTITEGPCQGWRFQQLWDAPTRHRFLRAMTVDTHHIDTVLGLTPMLGYIGRGHISHRSGYARLSVDSVQAVRAPERVYGYEGVIVPHASV